MLDKGRAALPSDLLFEFNSAELKQGARLGLMKLAILIDRNPQMFCILEGHTDSFGEDEYNLRLSRQRAEAVRNWLMKALRLDGQRIVVRAYGESKARLPEGDKDQQAINRRVDILMRKQLPPEEPVLIKPSRAVPVPTPMPTSEARPLETPSPRAVPVGERPAPVGRAVPVEEDPPRAVPAEPGRAQPVE